MSEHHDTDAHPSPRFFDELEEFVEQIGGIEKAREALAALEEADDTN